MLEDARRLLKNILGVDGDGFVIRNSTSNKTIETCNGIATKDDLTNTCALCVALNKTVFKNDNKPEYYHPNCKCKNESYNLATVTFDFPMSKITSYLFKDESKKELFESMGYDISDSNYLYTLMAENAKRKFMQGDYVLTKLSCHGQKLNIILELTGKNKKAGKIYKIKTGWTAYPYGCLHNNTPFGGWAKE